MKILLLIMITCSGLAETKTESKLAIARFSFLTIDQLDKRKLEEARNTQITLLRGSLLSIHKDRVGKNPLSGKMHNSILKLLLFLRKDYERFSKSSKVLEKNNGKDLAHETLMAWEKELRKSMISSPEDK
jgi:hypothetical protein